MSSGMRRKFSWGLSFSGISWSFVFGVRCLLRHNLTSYTVVVFVSVQGVQNGAPIFNLRALWEPPFLVHALSKFYEIFFIIAFLL